MSAAAHPVIWAALVLAPLVVFLAAVVGWHIGRRSARAACQPMTVNRRPAAAQLVRVEPVEQSARRIAGRAPVEIGPWPSRPDGSRS